MTKLNIRIEKELANIDSEKLNYTQLTEPVLEIKKLIEEKGCDVDGQNKDGDTLLHIVLKNGKIRTHNTVCDGQLRFSDVLDANYLVTKHHPNPFIKNKDGLTPSMLAAKLKLTAEWQFLSSYEQAYTAEHTGRVLHGLYVLSELNSPIKLTQIRGKRATKDIITNIIKLQGGRQNND